MKKLLPLVIGALLATPALAEFSTWTNADGRKAELELFNVTEANGEKTGEFRMRNGRSLTLKASDLVESDAARLAEFKPAAAGDSGVATGGGGAGSFFDSVLDGNLVILDGKGFKPFKGELRPKKYFIFYYTASWCPPCQAFTPKLVEFYTKNKNDNFDLVLITSDQDEKAMEGYAVKKHMPWQQLQLKMVPKFDALAKHGVNGIPAVVVCDLEGKVITKTQSIPELEKLVK
jgi:thiol-disulfide isomerase/thioredoxin